MNLLNSYLNESMNVSSTSLWSNCRPNVQRRINALLNNQAEYFRLRVNFYRQLKDLQDVYHPQFDEILQRRRKIIDGSDEPTEAEKEVHWPMTAISDSQRLHANHDLEHFWLVVLKNLDSDDYPIQPRDELCLKYLIDIRCIVHPSNTFTLEFQFSPLNPFFDQTVLTKCYSMRLEFDQDKPYRSYDGPEIDRCEGCVISWKTGQNLTIRKRNKRVRDRTTGQIRFVQIEESIRSFFDFFSPPLIPPAGIDQMTDEEEQVQLEMDIEFALFLKQHVLPKAILYFTGEALPIFGYEDLTSSES